MTTSNISLKSSIVFVKGPVNNDIFINCPIQRYFTPVDFISDNKNNYLLEKEDSLLEKFDLKWIYDFNESTSC